MRKAFQVAALFFATAWLHAQTPQPRLVFAHYMVTNQDYQGSDDDSTQEKKIAAYQREIREAQSVGIDGFALNVGGWLHEPYYIRYTAQIFEAALRLHSGFRLFFSADMCCGNTAADVEDMMRRFAGNPRYREVYFQPGGKALLTTFAGEKLGPAAWVEMRLDLLRGTHPSTQQFDEVLTPAKTVTNAPVRTTFVPAFFWGGEVPTRADIDTALKLWAPAIDGAFYWGIAGVPGDRAAQLDTARASAAYAASLHAAGKLYMAPAAFTFWGANADRYFEYSGGQGLRRLVQSAVESHADWLELITWNDFIEGTYVSPIDDPNRYPHANFLNSTGVPSDTFGYFPSHAGVTALLADYIRWYKTGTPPPVDHDALYVFYRSQSVHTKATKPSVANLHGPVRDVVYITANLTAPAELTVEANGAPTRFTLAAGSHEIAAPFQPGPAPRFTLRRNGKVVLQGEGASAIEADPRFRNFYVVTGNVTAKGP